MANMAHCRFTNTLSDLRECFDYMDDEDLSDREKKARTALMKLCVKIALDYGHDVGCPVESTEE